MEIFTRPLVRGTKNHCVLTPDVPHKCRMYPVPRARAVRLALPGKTPAVRLVRTGLVVDALDMAKTLSMLPPRAFLAPPNGARSAASAFALTKTYGKGDAVVRALDNVDIAFDRGRFSAVMGPSGSGKSTLMHCMAGLDVPTSGRTFVGDLEIGRLDDAGLTQMRRDRLGFVFQSFNLIPTLTAEENITLPADLAGVKLDKDWFNFLVGQLGLGDRLSHRPNEMSGGQQQRTACARALIRRPELVFADEPTGNLDSTASAGVLEFLRRAVDDNGESVVMVTHDANAATYADRVVFLADGRVVGELLSPTVDSVLDQMMKLRH